MDKELQRAIVRRVLALAEDETTQLADERLTVAATDYVDADTFALEQDLLFRKRPVVVCLSGDLRQPGDHVAGESGGVPYLVVRHHDGSARAFANICRHRGAPLVDPGCGHTERRFRCRFHGWTYDLDGAVEGRPNSLGGFDGAQDCDALAPLPVAEHAGMVLVRPVGHAPIDGEELLAGMSGELASFGFGDYHRSGQWVATWSANWKLLVETFLETYHVPTLHSSTVARYFLGRPSLTESFGPNLRFHSLMRTILDLKGKPDEEWSLLPYGTVEYLVSPSTVFNFSVDHLALYQFHPLAPDLTTSVLTLYTPAPITDEQTAQHYRRTLELHERVSGGEDFRLQEHVHRSLRSGVIDHVTIGRNEPAVIAFHQSLDDLLDR